MARHHGTDGGGNGGHGGAVHGRESKDKHVQRVGRGEEVLPPEDQRRRRLLRGGERGAPTLHPKVFDRELMGMEGALGKMDSMPMLLGVLGF